MAPTQEKEAAGEAAPLYDYPSVDLLKAPPVKRAVKSRFFQFALQVPVVGAFTLAIAAGLFGAPDPGANFATVATWTVWWVGVIILILFLGAAWCAMCPWSAVADWLERLTAWGVKEGIGLKLRWPRALRNRYPATVFFIAVTWLELGVFITYSPLYTAYMAFMMVFLAALTALFFERKSFCRYLCFVGGIVGMYSNLAPLEVRAKSAEVCGRCRTKDCARGSAKGYGCPIFEYPGGMRRNTNCIACSECVKTCPYDNMTYRLRPFLADLGPSYKWRLDEALLILTLLSLTFLHGFTMLPVWTDFAKRLFNTDYFGYMTVFTGAEAGFIAVAAALHLAVSELIRLFTGEEASRRREIFTAYAYALLPMAFFYHLSHNIHHLDMEGLAIIPALSDPFGFGWDILGVAGFTPFMIIGMGAMPLLQAVVIFTGAAACVLIAHRISRARYGGVAWRATVPVMAAAALYTALALLMSLQPMAMRTVSQVS